MGILGQLAIFAVTTWGVFLAEHPFPTIYIVPAIVDILFALAFLVFLWNDLKTV